MRVLFADRVVLDRPLRLIEAAALAPDEAGCRIVIPRPTSDRAYSGWEADKRLKIIVTVHGDDGTPHVHETTWQGGIRREKHGIEIPESRFSVAYWRNDEKGRPVPQWSRAAVSVELFPLTPPIAVDVKIETV
jgi:hypothetical protein